MIEDPTKQLCVRPCLKDSQPTAGAGRPGLTGGCLLSSFSGGSLESSVFAARGMWLHWRLRDDTAGSSSHGR